MLVCEAAGRTAHDFEDLAAFVGQLAALGRAPRVHVGSVPDGLCRNAQFDLAPYLIDGPLDAAVPVALVGAQRLDDDGLGRLARLAGSEARACLAFGRFGSRQATIGARAKLAYVFGAEPRVFDLATAAASGLGAGRDAPVVGVPRTAPPAPAPRLLLVAPPGLTERAGSAALAALGLSRRFRTAVLTDGKAKHAWGDARGRNIPFYHYGELLPASLADRVDICVCYAPIENNYRLRCLLANLMRSGSVLVDGTDGHRLAATEDAFLRGPFDLAGTAGFLAEEVLPNRVRLADHVRASRSAAAVDPEPVLAFLDGAGAPAPAPAVVGRPSPPGIADGRLVFMPTNGVGLGHAQRCSLVAGALDPGRPSPVFAAFPSCGGLLRACGFDVMPLIARSALHVQPHENDLANYLRLRALTAGAAALVFDGGYVFDSVYRSIFENRLPGIWIRRGLWQAEQDNSVALDREKAFDRVIVPHEAFDELNAAYSHGDHLQAVGPIVQRLELAADARRTVRDRLAERFGRPFDRLVVSLLGAGVAADRGAQIQALCGMLDRRPDTLHLVVAWPTAALDPPWFGWSASRVVRTHHAGVLAAAADLCIGAAGYNTFHEALYNALPTVFVPQMGPFMDDQRARARAACDRGLALMVEPGELMALERAVGRMLDDGEGAATRQRLAALDLPETGTAAAARLIEETAHGEPSLDRDSVAHHPGRRR